MSDEKSIYPRIGMWYAYTTDMKNEIVKKFNEGNFTRWKAF